MDLNELYTLNNLGIKIPQKGSQTNRDTLAEYIEGLKQEGFTALGQGKFGAVFTSEHLGYAVKIFSSSDLGYLSFLRYILDHRGNPHLPRIRGRFKSISKDYSACRLELLERVSEDEGRAIDRLCQHIMTGFLKPESFIKDVRKTYTAMNQELFSDAYLETMFDLYRYGRRNSRTFDLHAGNVMKRDRTLVIVDPFT